MNNSFDELRFFYVWHCFVTPFKFAARQAVALF